MDRPVLFMQMQNESRLLVCSGCHRTVPRTWRLIHSRHSFSWLWNLKSKGRVPAWPRAGEEPPAGCRCSPCWTLTGWEENRGTPWGPIYTGTDPLQKDSAFMTNSPPKGPLPNTNSLGVRISTNEFKGNVNKHSVDCRR